MKSGWEVRRLEDVTTKIGSGATPRGGKNAYKRSGISLIRSLNVHDLDFRTKDLAHIDGEQADALSNVIVKENDILLNITGASIARCTTVPPGILPARVNQHVAIIRPKHGELDSQYLSYLLVSPHSKQRLLGIGEAGSTRQALTKAQLQAFTVPLPPLEEQQRIVAILDEAFEGLGCARANAVSNLTSARELFDNSLMTIFSDVNSVASRLTLSSAASVFGRGRSRHRPRNAAFLYGGPYPFVQTGDIRNSNGTVVEYSQTYSEDGLSQSKLWPAGTVCITIAANIAETAVLGFDACFPDSIIGMVANPEVTSPDYVELMLRYFANGLKEKGKGSAQDNINLGTFEETTFPFPPLQKQREIVELLTRISRETASLADAYRTNIRDCEVLRQSLLQKAFAGELT